MLQPPIQLRLTKPQFEHLNHIRETVGTPLGEQIRTIIDVYLEANVLNAKALDQILDNLPPHGTLERRLMPLPPRPKIRRK